MSWSLAAGGLIAPSATAAYQGTFDAKTGGSQAVRVHFDLASAGGAAALAANVLTIIADRLGASLVASSPSKLTAALQLLMALPGYAELLRAAQQPADLWGLVSAIETLFGTATAMSRLSRLSRLRSRSAA